MGATLAKEIIHTEADVDQMLLFVDIFFVKVTGEDRQFLLRRCLKFCKHPCQTFVFSQPKNKQHHCL